MSTAPVTWNPWRVLRDEFPDWDARFVPLPEGQHGATDHRHRIIWISDKLDRGGRRATLSHELQHVRQGHDGPCTRGHEEQIEETSARALLPIADLLRVLPWAASLQEAADELDVDTGSLHIRIKRLHPAERAAIKRAFAARDNEEIA
jgi:hypothetical protein